METFQATLQNPAPGEADKFRAFLKDAAKAEIRAFDLVQRVRVAVRFISPLELGDLERLAGERGFARAEFFDTKHEEESVS